jgi:hypothetical protein
MLGGAVPDVAAGAGLGLATAAWGWRCAGRRGRTWWAAGGIRPGTVEERATRAILGSALSVGGAAVGPVAVKGIGLGLKMFGTMENRALSGVSQAAEAGITRGRAAELASSRQAAAAAEPGSQAPLPPGSVGAARTPAGLAPEDETGALLRETEQAGAENISAGFGKKLDRAIDLGWKPPIGQGTRAFSRARLGQSVQELGGPVAEQWAKASNQRLLAQHAAKAMGFDDWQNMTRIDNSFLDHAEAKIGEEFRSVERRLPPISVDEYANSLGKIDQTETLFEKTRGQMIIDTAIKKAEARKGGEIGNVELMATRRQLSQKMSEFYRQGETEDGNIIRDALNRLDSTIEAEIKKNKYKIGLSEKWASARQQWQVKSMVEHGASASASGDINPVSLMRQLRKDRSSGGFGRGGPADKQGAASELFDLTEVAADAETGVPMTGARLLIRQGKRAALGGAVGAAGFGGVSSLWD